MTIVGDRDEMYAGNRRVLKYTIYDADAVTPNTPLNLTPYTAKWTMSKMTEDGVPFQVPELERKSSAGQITFTDALNGKLEVLVAEALTVGFEGVFACQLELYDGSNNSNIVAVNELEIKRNVTNT